MASIEDAIRIRDQLSKRGDLREASANGFGIMAARSGDGYGVKIGFERGPIPDLPAEIDGVPIDAEIVGRI